MKIQCQSCQAKYTIADEKVLGKVVKIRCKKCSSTIVINGNDQAASADAGGDNAFDYAGGGAGGDQWTVNVADGDQRTMTVAEITNEYRNGVVNDETYCWKDGMADWLPLREIDAIYGSVKGGGVDVQPAASVPPAAAPLFGASTVPSDAFAGSVSPKPANGGAGALFGAAADPAPAPAAAAARRAGGRGQGGDLFGNVEKAGGEDEVMTSAATAAVAANAAASVGAAPADDKLTGQRNENSVLFSLSALTETKKESGGGGGGSRGATTATGDGSGLIDIRALSANMDEDKSSKKDKGTRVDDIMNLSGGGAFGAALAAPILAPPPLEPVDLGVTAPSEPQKQNKGMMFAILGGCAFIAIAIVVAVVLTRGPAPAEGAAKTSDSAGATSTSTAATTVATNDTPPPTPTNTGNEPAPPATGGNAGKTPTVVPGPKVAAAPRTGGGESAPAAAPAPAAPAPAAQPKSLAESMAAAAGQPAAAPAPAAAANGASFDKGAAAGALGKVDVQGCKKADGPTGAGHVTVTFGPDGSVQTAVVDQGPYPGTAVGGCVAGRFKGAHVPAFSGAPVRVGKSFIIN